MNQPVFWIITLAVVVFIFWPFWRQRFRLQGAANGVSSRLADLLSERDNLFSALKDLEFDHEMGKISAEDYRQMQEQYKTQAIQILKRIDAVRGKVAPVRDGELDRANQAFQPGEERACPECASPVADSDRFCSRCGHKLNQ